MGSHFWLNLIATTYILLKAFHFHCRLKMIRIIVLLGLFLFISGVHPSPLPPGIDYEEKTKEEVAELLTDLFREAKDIDVENEVGNNDVEYELIQEDKLNTDPDEVAKYNTYMDAVFRRMNAALRAKLDPMELNLDSKQKKNPRNSKKDKNGAKSRKSRALEEEEPQEDEKEVDEEVNEEGVDRVGKVAKKEKNKAKKAKKNKGDKKEKKEKKDKSKLSKEERKEQKA